MGGLQSGWGSGISIHSSVLKGHCPGGFLFWILEEHSPELWALGCLTLCLVSSPEHTHPFTNSEVGGLCKIHFLQAQS